MSKSKVLFMLSGSIAAYKACAVISRLVQEGHDVQTVATDSALKFIGAATLEGLTGKPVYHDLWQPGQMMDHIHLSRWADYGVLCPASANTLAGMAHGMAHDLVTSLVLAWPQSKPLHIFPAMNQQMIAAEPTQKNLRLLSERGFQVHATQSGNLACGEEGPGRLLEPEQIFSLIASPTRTKGRILITIGATREPIDGIRFLSNVSTGQTGATLADRLALAGWSVTCLHGQGSVTPSLAQSLLSFQSYDDLETQLRAQLGGHDFAAVIQCAAVSDYSVVNPRTDGKLSSTEELSLQFKRNAKLLPKLKLYSRNKSIRVIGFKLTFNADPDELFHKAQALLNDNVDAIVANDWAEVHRDRRKHPGRWLTNANATSFSDLDTLAFHMDQWLAAKESHHDLES